MAADELHLNIDEERTLKTNGQMYVTSLKIGSPLSKQSYKEEAKTFWGKTYKKASYPECLQQCSEIP